MVLSGVREEGEEGESMEMGSERSSKPLHNFALPRTLKWGNQRHLRCMKVQDSSTKEAEVETETAAVAVDQPPVRRRSSPSRLSSISEARRWRERTLFLSKPRTDGGVGGGDEEEEEGIEAVREKIMNDLKFAADKMKDAILREEVSDSEKEKEDSAVSPAAALAAAATAAQESARPWNLRNRRAAGKSPIGGQAPAAGSPASSGFFKFEAMKPTSSSSPMRSEAAGGAKSPRVLRGGGAEKEDKIEWPKFSLTLTKKEIEEDFLKMTNHRPPRRPKRRPKNVQKQLDTLFPGSWLPDVTADSYKVPESAENGKK